MPESKSNATSFVTTGLRFAVVAALILLSGCGSDSAPPDENSAPPDEKVDECPVDDTKTEEGLCGCGIPDTDSDSDGTPDCLDACPEDPGTIPDEFGFCGDTGDSAVVVEGEALTLAVNGAVFTIPADALEPGTTVSLAEIDPALLDELPNSSDETRITPIYALEFSAAQLTRDHVSFALDVPSTLARVPYTRVQIEGGLATEGQSDTGWLPKIGSYEQAQSLLVIKLGATATRFLITGLTRISATPTAVAASAAGSELRTPDLMQARAPAAPMAVAASTAGSELRTPDLMQARALAIPAAAFSEEPAWTEHGWLVMCDPEDFERHNDDRCDVESTAFESMMEDVASSLYASDQQLTSLFFPRGRVSRVTPATVAKNYPYLYYDPDGRSVATAGASGGDPEYFKAWVTPDTTTPDTEDNIFGTYHTDLEFIQVDVDLVPSLRNLTTIHELMHAVQRIEIVDVWDDDWIIEGLASAVQPDAPGYSGPKGADYRYFEEWRDWKYDLTREQSNDEYEVLEFWLSLTGDMSAIPRFHEWIRGIDSSIETNSLLRVDEALTATGLPSLSEAYTSLILTRDGQNDYPYCAGGLSFCSDLSCSRVVEDVQPFSAHCRTEVIEFDTCDDEPAELTVTLETDSPNPHIKLILGGTVYDANTPVDFPNDGERYWVINTDLEEAIMSPGPTATLVFEDKAECGNPYLSIVSQEISSSVTMVADGSTLGRFASIEKYNSYDDLSRGSVLTTGEGWGSSTEVSVPPLGKTEWTSAHSGSAFSQNSEELPVSTVTASSSTSTVIVSDATSMTTTGVHTATATRTEDAGYARGNNQSSYTFATKDVPAELTLTWGCDMSSVQVLVTTPDVGTEALLGVNNLLPPSPFNNWECEPRSWTIAADAIVTIKMYTSYQFYNDDTSAQYRNGGGAYEIKLQAIIPD